MLGVVFTTEPPSSGSAARVADQLLAAGVRDVLTVNDLGALASIAASAEETLLLCTDELVAHDAVLWHLATNPVTGTVALVLPESATWTDRVREERGRLVRGESNAAFGGAIRIDVRDLPAVVATARGAVGVWLDALPPALLGAGVTIFTQRVRLLVAARTRDAQTRAAAEAAVAGVDADAARLRLSVKEKDDFFATYFVSTWSPRLTRWAARIGLGPSAVTAISVGFAVAAALLFWLGDRPALLLGAVLLYLGFVLDCVDGQVARYTRNFSAFGGWLDTMADRAKEYAVYAGLAAGADRAGLADGWTLALAALTLQTVRHMTDTWYGALHDEAASRAAPAAGRLSAVSNRVQADQGSLAYWLKRTVVFPIGERWALMALTVALFDQRVALVAMLVWGGLAAAYTLLLRALRAWSMRVPVLATVDATRYRDDGEPALLLGRLRGVPPLVAAAFAAVAAGAAVAGAASGMGRVVIVTAVLPVLAAGLGAGAAHAGALDWLVPAALRAAELLFVVAVGVAFDVPSPVLYALLLVLALHHYDLTARLEKRTSGPPLHRLSLGWDGRVLLLAAGAAVGAATAATAMLGGYLLAVLLASALATWAFPVWGRDGADRLVFHSSSRGGRA